MGFESFDDMLDAYASEFRDPSWDYDERPKRKENAMTKKQQQPKPPAKDDPRQEQPTDRELKAAVKIGEIAELNPKADFPSELAFQCEMRGILEGGQTEVYNRLHRLVMSAGGNYTIKVAQSLAEQMEAELTGEAPPEAAEDDEAPAPSVNLPDFQYADLVENPDLSKLFQYLPQSDIEWRQGATTADKKKIQMLPYVDARGVMRVLNETFGLFGWRAEYTPIHGGGFICRLWVFYKGEWHFKEDGANETNIEAVKGGISGALKRAAAAWGIAQYLYYSDPVWIAVPEGQKYVSNQQKAGLRVRINGKQVGE